jgi:colanic acid biosynthesis glycosyl transferase WcaI
MFGFFTRLTGKGQNSRNDEPARSRILIYGINFAPEQIGVGKYTTELADYLVNRGHEVEVVTAPPHYPGWEVKAPYRSVYSRKQVGGVDVRRCPMFTKANAPGIWRVLAPLSFALSSAPIVIWRILLSRPDVVLCIEPTLFCAPALLLASKLSGSRTFLHVQDLEIDAAFDVGHLNGNGARRIANAVEHLFLRAFDGVITISEKMKERLIGKGLAPNRVTMVRNWIDLSRIQPMSGRNAFRNLLGISQDRFVALYAGHLGAKQGLGVLLDAIKSFSDRDNFSFVIVGEGPMKDQLVRDTAELPFVHFLPLQPAENMSELLSMANVHVLPQQSGAADLVMPSKLGGMLASGVPIVATADPGTEVANILKDIALVVPAGDSRGLAAMIRMTPTMDLQSAIAEGLALAEQMSALVLLPRFENALLGEPLPDERRQSGALKTSTELEVFH